MHLMILVFIADLNVPSHKRGTMRWRPQVFGLPFSPLFTALLQLTIMFQLYFVSLQDL